MSVPGADWARSPPITGVSEDQRGTYVAIWAKTVDTQMHFNEMSVKSRQFGLGFVAAALGLGILLLSRGQEFALSIKISRRLPASRDGSGRPFGCIRVVRGQHS